MGTPWLTRLRNFNVATLFTRSRPPGVERTIFVNEELPHEYFDPKGRAKKDHIYLTNQVITSKYTIITFLPRNLLEQFRRVANIFFLAIAILQFFPKFSTVSPGLVILPLLVVLAFSAIKDGYEDYKRHQSDNVVNNSKTLVLEGGGWTNPNHTGNKSKTFIKGVIPHRRKKSPGDTDIETATGSPNPSEQPAASDLVYDDDDEHEQVQRRRTSRRFSRQSFRPRSQASARDIDRPHWKSTSWEDVKVGDFVKIRANEPFPADILICATSEAENVCYVETKNLDGETNLKSRNAIPALTHLRNASACADKQARFHVDCEAPDVNLYKLNAAVVTGQKPHPIDSQAVLLRGTVLRNTNWVIGVVLFTGEDTKIMLNSGGTPSKRSQVERQMNPQVLINLSLLAAMATACAIVDSSLEKKDYPEGAPWLFDDNRSGDNPSVNGIITWANALITFQNVVPISLYISIEAVRTIQAAFIYVDRDIYYEKTDTPTLSRSWNLSDDLGQIEYIFSDKTGTLTQNAMIFRQCSIGGRTYTGNAQQEQEVEISIEDKVAEKRVSDTSTEASRGYPGTPPAEITIDTLGATAVKLPPSVLTHFKDSQLSADIKQAASGRDPEDTAFSRALNGFFVVLALCHTVIASVDPETNAIEYRAQSPDEAALVQAAADAGFVFRGRDKDILSLQTPFSENIEEYQLLNILDFTSARKRMSVVLRKLGDDSRVFLLTKGADNVIFSRLKAGGNDGLKEATGEHLDMFASEGLRTLCLAYKVVPEDVYEEWAARYHDATVALNDREDKVERVSDELERDLRLLGATAIEDKLQDGVPETIADLKRAGLKVWVLTGDKLETAIAIGYSTNLVAKDSNLIVVRGSEESQPYSTASQLCAAVLRFFPNSGIFDIVRQKGIEPPSEELRQQISGDSRVKLMRRQSGMSDIVGKDNGNRSGGYVLVIDGAGLGHALDESFSKELLLQLAIQCEAVICCRVSPLQKALVVKLAKDGLNCMTLAIGDGANDVSMIQAADVGVGISGEEGLQAVNSSDYAIAQFRFLKRLLFVHGHWSYARNGNMIVNFFYKNIVCIGVLWWFQIYCAWSTQYVFSYVYLLFWNVFWTLCPVIAMGIFDRPIDADILMAIPELYRYSRQGRYFGFMRFSIYMIEGVYQATVIFFFLAYTYRITSPRHDGFITYIYEGSTTMMVAAVMVVTATNGLNTTAWTGWVWFALLVGPILVWGFTAIYSLVSPGWFYTDVFGNSYFLFRSTQFWFGGLLTTVLALLPRYLFKFWQRQLAPTDIDILRELRRRDPNHDIANDRMLGGRFRRDDDDQISTTDSDQDLALRPPEYPPRVRPGTESRASVVTDMSMGGVEAPHRGFGFTVEEGGVSIRRIQTDLSERRMREIEEGDSRSRNPKRRGHPVSLFPNLRRSLHRRRHGDQSKDGNELPPSPPPASS